MNVRALGLLLACLLSMTGPCASGESLTKIEVALTTDGGDVGLIRVALCDSRECYSGKRPSLQDKDVAPVRARAVVTFEVPAGSYAIMTYHDRNANKKLDRNFVGMPAEPYGFSGNARSLFGPPPFGEVVFAAGEQNHRLEIRLH